MYNFRVGGHTSNNVRVGDTGPLVCCTFIPRYWRQYAFARVGAIEPKVATVAKDRADGIVRGVRKSGLPAAIGRVNRAVRIADYRQRGGTRTTTATPAWRIRNDVPITDTHEVWTSNAMKLVLLRK